jgi:hypothetical protein
MVKCVKKLTVACKVLAVRLGFEKPERRNKVYSDYLGRGPKVRFVIIESMAMQPF